MKKLSVYLLLSGLLWVGCRKDEPEPELEFLTPEEDEFLASQPDATGFNDFTVILPNGLTVAEFLAQTDSLNMASEDRGDPYDNLGPQDARNRLILHFAQLACRLVDRDQFKYPDNDPPSMDSRILLEAGTIRSVKSHRPTIARNRFTVWIARV